MGKDIEDLEQLNQRMYDYLFGRKIQTNELSREDYLKRLHANERKNLVYLLETIFDYDNHGLAREFACFAGLAIGTITFPEEYWSKTKDLLKREAPGMMHIVERRGEDIDIKLCSEECCGILNLNEIYDTIKRLLDAKGIKYEFEENVREDGHVYSIKPKDAKEVLHRTAKKQRDLANILKPIDNPDYLKVSSAELSEKAEQEREKRAEQGTKKSGNISRSKMYKYVGSSFKIIIPGSREFHLAFEKSGCIEHKLIRERVYNEYFSILFRGSNICGLRKTKL